MKYDDVAGTPDYPQFWETVVRGSVETSNSTTQNVQNVFHLRRVNDGSDNPTATQVNNFMAGVIGSDLTPCLTDDWFAVVETRPMDDPSAGAVADTATLNGDIATDRLPLDNAVYVELLSGLRGRSYRGSKHFAPIAEADTIADELTPGSLTAHWNGLIAGLQTLCTPFDLGGDSSYRLTIISPTKSDLSGSPTLFSGVDAETIQLSTTLGTMRKRKQTRRGD